MNHSSCESFRSPGNKIFGDLFEQIFKQQFLFTLISIVFESSERNLPFLY